MSEQQLSGRYRHAALFCLQARPPRVVFRRNLGRREIASNCEHSPPASELCWARRGAALLARPHTHRSEMRGMRLKNDLPAYLSTAAAWLSSMELDRNDTWPTIHGEGAALLALQRPQVPRVGPPRLRLRSRWHPPLPPSSAYFRSATTCSATPAQLSALADYVQGSLMLRANKRFHLLG